MRRARAESLDLQGLSAIVTGGGSGIGAALVRALAAAGVHVACADIDLDAAHRTVASVPTGSTGSAWPVEVDVTDPASVQAVVDAVVTQRGSLDLLFNNAGITFGGETEDLTLEQWNAIIDVNIRGVVHGVAAAYPLMVRQGHGHIVNTASMGGLMAAGLITSYVTTKHAVVGLSLALRSEAASKGVRVTAVCPSAVETPILDKGQLGRFNGRDFYLKGQGVRHPLDPDVLATQVLEAVRTDQPLLVTPWTARAAWRFGRLAPVAASRAAARFVDKQRRLQGRRRTA
jgi:NAD(P)-dependent dehydrogenase (short-subunit alcohol dehydrogenase family)